MMIVYVDLPDQLVHCEDVKIFYNEVQHKPVPNLFKKWKGIGLQNILNIATLKWSPTLKWKIKYVT